MIALACGNTLLPLDDCLYALQATIPRQMRSSLHRCLRRHGTNRLPEVVGDKPVRANFKTHAIGYFKVDLDEVRIEQGQLYLLAAIDRKSKFAFSELHEKATIALQATSCGTWPLPCRAVPCRIYTVLTENGAHFTNLPAMAGRPGTYGRRSFRSAATLLRRHAPTSTSSTKPRHPWTYGQVERMNRTTNEATVKRYRYETHDQLLQQLTDFVAADNFARRLKILRRLTLHEAICKAWKDYPCRFISNPHHQSPGPNI